MKSFFKTILFPCLLLLFVALLTAPALAAGTGRADHDPGRQQRITPFGLDRGKAPGWIGPGRLVHNPKYAMPAWPVPAHKPHPTCKPVITPVPTPYLASQSATFRESGGLVVMEAENFAAMQEKNSHSWQVTTRGRGYAGSGYIRAVPDNGTYYNTNYAELAPETQYHIYLETAGTYYIWTRAYAGDQSGNSAHAGLDREENTTANRLSFPVGEWAWSNSRMDKGAARITVGGAGFHVFNLWMREDGVLIDRILLTADPAYKPHGKGPAESARIGLPTPSPTPAPTQPPTEQPTNTPTRTRTYPPTACACGEGISLDFANALLNAEVVTTAHVNSGTRKVAAYHVEITYDPAILRVNTAIGTSGVEAAADGFVSAVNPGTAGKLVIAGFETAGKGPGTNLALFRINWIAIGTGTTNIGIKVIALADEAHITIGTLRGIGGTITVYYSADEIPTPAPTPTRQPTSPPTVPPDYPGLVYQQPAYQQAGIAETITTHILVNSGSHIVAAYGLDIFYDPVVLTVDTAIGMNGVTPAAAGFVSAVNSNTLGRLVITGFSMESTVSGTARELLNIHWRAAGTGITNIHITVNTLTNAVYENIGIPRGSTGSVLVYTGDPPVTQPPTQPPVTPQPTPLPGQFHFFPAAAYVYPGDRIGVSVFADSGYQKVTAFSTGILYDPALAAPDAAVGTYGVLPIADGFVLTVENNPPGNLFIQGVAAAGKGPDHWVPLCDTSWLILGAGAANLTFDRLGLVDENRQTIGNPRAGNEFYIGISEPTPVPEIIDFPDPELENAVRDYTGKFEGDLYNTDVMYLGEFSCYNRNIHDLTGLEYFTGLYYLNIYDCPVSDLSPLEHLEHLTGIYMSMNNISDLSPLAGLTSLTALSLDYNTVSDLTPLAGLAALENLSLINNRITDIGSLAGLAKLNTLFLDNNYISDLTPLAELTALQNLGISYNNIPHLAGLEQLTLLSYLYAEHNHISSLEPLANKPDLTELNLNSNHLLDLSPLAGCRNLNHLLVSDNFVSDLSPLSGLGALQYFDADNNRITDATPLSTCSWLLEVFINHNELSDLTPLAALPYLSTLHISANQVSDLSPLTGAASLNNLDLSGNRITDIAPLASIPRLYMLYLDANPVADFSPLAGCVSLYALSLGSCGISDPGFLSGLTQLNDLTLDHNLISDLTLLADFGNLVYLDLSGNRITDLAPLTNLYNLNCLAIGSNGITDITPLSNCPYLSELTADHNRISDLTPLAGLSNLGSIDMDSNLISDLQPLAGMINLNSLDASYNLVTDLSPLADCSNMSVLAVNSNSITDITALAGMDYLAELYLADNHITDITALSGKKYLTTLAIEHNGLSDLTPLGSILQINTLAVSAGQLPALPGLPGLQSLAVRDIADLSGLAGFPYLKQLDLHAGAITDLAPLTGLVHLETLNLDTNNIGNIDSLAGLTNLEDLSLRANSLIGVSSLAGLAYLRNLALDANAISSITALAALDYLKTLGLKQNPLDATAVTIIIPQLIAKGVTVTF